jgi:membrane fusion protein (multidrug efflux system)
MPNSGARRVRALRVISSTGGAADAPLSFHEIARSGQCRVCVAEVAVNEDEQHTSLPFSGRVTRTAGALYPATRTLTTEIEVPNPAGELLPGMSADATLPVAVSHPVVRVPSSAIIYDSTGVHVAVVDGASRVQLVTVQPGRDDGTDVEIVDGGERVVVSPPAGLSNGVQIDVAG